MQTAPAPPLPENNITSPNPVQPNSPDQRLQGYRQLLTDFTFGLGSGLSAANQNPRGRGQRTQAGIGQILQVPRFLQEAQKAEQDRRDAQKQAVIKLILDKQRADAQTANEQSLAASRIATDLNTDQTNARIVAQNEAANDIKRQDLAIKTEGNAANLRKAGLKRDADGNIIPIPREEMTDAEIAKLDAAKNLDDLRAAQNDLATANAALSRAKLDPTSPIYQDAKEKADLAQKRLDLAQANLGIRQQSQSVRSGKQTNEYYAPALTADSRLATMISDAGPDFQGRGGQSDLQLLFNHIGMTLSAQKGTRVTEAEIQRAIDSRSLPETLMARWDALKSGKFLSPQERQQMVENGKETRNRAWYDSRRAARLAGIDEEPEQDSTLPALIMPGPANPAKGAPISTTPSGAKAIEQYSPSTKQYRYSTDGGKTWQAGRAPK